MKMRIYPSRRIDPQREATPKHGANGGPTGQLRRKLVIAGKKASNHKVNDLGCPSVRILRSDCRYGVYLLEHLDDSTMWP
jgi:hypothetical protein